MSEDSTFKSEFWLGLGGVRLCLVSHWALGLCGFLFVCSESCVLIGQIRPDWAGSLLLDNFVPTPHIIEVARPTRTFHLFQRI